MKAHAAGSFLSARPAWARSLPFAVFLAFLAAENNFATLQGYLPVLAGWDGRWLYAAKTVATAGLLAALWPQYTELRKRPAGGANWLWALATGVGIFWLWIHLTQPWATLGQAGAGFDPKDANGRIDWTLAMFRLGGAMLAVPLMEELFWRSFIMRWLKRNDFLAVDPVQTGVKALAISSALFAVEHTLWLAGLLAGLAYGLLYIKTKNLWFPIMAHAVTNGALGFWVLATGNWQFW